MATGATGHARVVHQRARSPDRPDLMATRAGVAGHRGDQVSQ